jgi:hypothetical protein
MKTSIFTVATLVSLSVFSNGKWLEYDNKNASQVLGGDNHTTNSIINLDNYNSMYSKVGSSQYSPLYSCVDGRIILTKDYLNKLEDLRGDLQRPPLTMKEIQGIRDSAEKHYTATIAFSRSGAYVGDFTISPGAISTGDECDKIPSKKEVEESLRDVMDDIRDFLDDDDTYMKLDID